MIVNSSYPDNRVETSVNYALFWKIHHESLSLLEEVDGSLLSYRQYVSTIPCNHQIACDIGDLLSNNENGLLSQWILNPCGERYDIVIDHLHKIGAPRAKQVISKIGQIFPDSKVPIFSDERVKTIVSGGDDLIAHIEDLSTRLMYDCEDLCELAGEYIICASRNSTHL